MAYPVSATKPFSTYLPSVETDTGMPTPESKHKEGRKSLKLLPSPFGKGTESGEQAGEQGEEERTPSKTQIRHKPHRLSSSMTLDSPY